MASLRKLKDGEITIYPITDSTGVYHDGEQLSEVIDNKANIRNNYGGFEGGYNANASVGGAIGAIAKAGNGGAIGAQTITGDGFAGGMGAQTVNSAKEGIDAIQLGTGTNNNEKTLQVYSYQLMDANGNIPIERIESVIGNLDSLKTENKENLVNAINELKTNTSSSVENIGTLSNLTTTNKDNLVEAINEVNSGLNDVKSDVEDIENSEIALSYSFLDNYNSFKNKLELYTSDTYSYYDARDDCTYYDSKGNAYSFDINIKMIRIENSSLIDIFSDITLNEEFFIIHYEKDGLDAPQSINDLPIGDNDYYLFKDIDSNSFDLEHEKYYLAAVTKYMVDGGIDPGEAGIVTVYGEIYPNAILAIENRKTEYNLKSTNTNIGTLSNLTTTDKDNLVEAINEVDADITSINGDISDINTDIGTIADLHTTEKDNLVDAINSASMEIINEIPPVSPTTPTYSKSESCTLDKNEYYCYMDLTSLSLSLNVSNETSADYISSVTFTSGETATSINYPDTIHWVTGSEDVIDGVFAPIPNRRYTLTFFTDGWVICGIVNSVEVTEDDKPNLTGVTLDPDERPDGGNSGGPSYEI